MKIFKRGRSSLSTAAEWFAQVRSGGVDSAQDAEWQQWMAADAENPQAYDNLELTWELSEELRDRPRIKELLSGLDVRLKGAPAQPPRPRLFGLGLSWQSGFAAAAVVLACIAAVFMVKNRTTAIEYATDVGEQRTVTLEDQSTISLNTATRVRVQYSHAVRHIELAAGEALFTVTHDGHRPFEVHALRGTTTAVGTEFDVQIADTATAVSVLKGTVAVRSTEDAGGSATQISEGQALNYTADGATSSIRRADVDKIHAWLAQRIVFSDVTLAEAVADYNRYIKTPIVLGNPGLGERRINGVFRVGDQTAFLNALEQGLHVTATTTESGIVLQPR